MLLRETDQDRRATGAFGARGRLLSSPVVDHLCSEGTKMSTKRIIQTASALVVMAAAATWPKPASASVPLGCSAGGPGATSCSCGSGGCSVTCEAGFYASCSDTGCHCN